MPAFVLTIDIEPTPRMLEPGVPPSWGGLDAVVERLQRFRETMAARDRPIHFSWFPRVDPQIEAASGDAAFFIRERQELLRGLVAQGDDIGIHFHDYRWLPDQRRWISDHANSSWIFARLQEAFAAFESAWGSRARIFRFGDRWMDDRVLAMLDRLGVEIDLTVEPGSGPAPPPAGELASADMADMRGAPLRPYVPSRRDYRRTARWFERSMRLRAIPITTGCVNGEPFPSAVTAAHDMVPMNLGLHAHWIRHVLRGAIQARFPVIATVLRSGDMAASDSWSSFLENLAFIESERGFETFQFFTPHEALRSLGVK